MPKELSSYQKNQAAYRAKWKANSKKLSVRISDDAFEALNRLSYLGHRSDCAQHRSHTASCFLEEVLFSADDALDAGHKFKRLCRFDAVPGEPHSFERWRETREIDALLDKISASDVA